MKLLLADDHPIFRKGLKALIEDNFQNVSIVECDNGTDAIEIILKSSIDIAIIDIDMPKKSGIEVLRHLNESALHTRTVILTMHNDELFFNEAFNQGAMGFLLKEDSTLEIVACINNVLNSIPFVSDKLTGFLSNRKSFREKISTIKSAINSLSNAEFNTLKLVSENLTSKEIAELLFVTEKSVENYRSRICKKLSISGGSNTLYKWCIENKDLIKQDSSVN